MGLYTIEIDDSQVLTLSDLSGLLAKTLGWTWHEVEPEVRKCAWDFHFRDSAGEHWMTLDGLVYDRPDCTGSPVRCIDIRAELAVELVWASDPESGHPLVLVQW